MTMRLSISSLAGTARTLVAVGTVEAGLHVGDDPGCRRLAAATTSAAARLRRLGCHGAGPAAGRGRRATGAAAGAGAGGLGAGAGLRRGRGAAVVGAAAALAAATTDGSEGE